MDEKEAEAPPVMGTIFLVARLAVLFGINSTSDARNSTRRSPSAICGITSAINSK